MGPCSPPRMRLTRPAMAALRRWLFAGLLVLAPLGILLSWALFLLATSPRSGARNRAAAT